MGESALKSYADPVAVEQQLRKIQQEVSPNEARTNLFNLVVYVDKWDDARLTEALNFLHGKRPARVIVVHRNAGGETQTDVTARCVTDKDDKVLCIQEIVISCGDDAAGRSLETWTPLLIREIPVFVWWLAALDDAPLPGLFDDIADRVFIDSDLAKDALGFLGNLATRAGDFKTPVTDFAWSRVAPLLKLTAHAFNAADRRPLLAEIASVTFQGGQPAEVALYVQWLKTKLDWKGTSAPTGKAWTLADEAGKAVSVVHRSPAELEAGFSVTFGLRSAKSLTLKDSREGFAVAEGDGLEKYTSVFRYLSTGEVLLTEVDRNASDRLFLELLGRWS
ncbi:MAG TPA: glucose-6-phosphate dehydrogenase assembly protein OpcA [Spirochaetia bacterium]|jgi:glucose-6-phosphate dehydrogenase assembly protein OpcA|nr:glucose-6-phosphate dehydrogenase assembly protein OpcA [Spirochaetia bacterium]